MKKVENIALVTSVRRLMESRGQQLFGEGLITWRFYRVTLQPEPQTCVE